MYYIVLESTISGWDHFSRNWPWCELVMSALVWETQKLFWVFIVRDGWGRKIGCFPLLYGSQHPVKLQHWIWHHLTGHYCMYLACHRSQGTWQILHISSQLTSDDFDFEIKVLNFKKSSNIIKIDISILMLIHLILTVLCQNRFV